MKYRGRLQLKAIIAAESNRWEQVKAILEAAPAGDRTTIGDLMLGYLSRSAVSENATAFALEVLRGNYLSGEGSIGMMAQYLVKAGQAEAAQPLVPRLTGLERARLQILLAGDAKRRGDAAKTTEFVEAARLTLKTGTIPSPLPLRELSEAGLDEHLPAAIEEVRSAALKESSPTGQRFDLIELASDLLNAGKSDLALAELKRATSITYEFAKCRDLAKVAYVYAKASQFAAAGQAVDSCSEEGNILWKLYAHMAVFRVRAAQVNQTFKERYDPFNEQLSLEYQFKFNAPYLR